MKIKLEQMRLKEIEQQEIKQQEIRLDQLIPEQIKSNLPKPISWKRAFEVKSKMILLIAIPIGSIVFLGIVAPDFLNYVEHRKGIVLYDPILALFRPIDVSWITFVSIYVSVLIGVGKNAFNPYQIFVTFHAYSLVTFLRMFSVFLTNLDPPLTTIPLVDPVLSMFVYGHKNITKDLFFSGHASTMCLLYLSAHQKYLRWFFALGTLVVSGLVLSQHVHYSIDVLAAVPISWFCYHFMKKFVDHQWQKEVN